MSRKGEQKKRRRDEKESEEEDREQETGNETSSLILHPSSFAATINYQISTTHGSLRLPIYLPDATLGVVRAVDASDLRAVGIEALVMNVFHLMQKPGSSTIAALGGLHKMADWTRRLLRIRADFKRIRLCGKTLNSGH